MLYASVSPTLDKCGHSLYNEIIRVKIKTKINTMNNRQFERLVGNLQNVMRCPHCAEAYQLTDIHYLGQMEDITFLHMRCSACNTPVFASVAVNAQTGEGSPVDIVVDDIAIGRDLNAEADLFDSVDGGIEDDIATPINIPVRRPLSASLRPVSYDDVLDVHLKLRDIESLDSLLG
jgi:hypothetical protein